MDYLPCGLLHNERKGLPMKAISEVIAKMEPQDTIEVVDQPKEVLCEVK